MDNSCETISLPSDQRTFRKRRSPRPVVIHVDTKQTRRCSTQTKVFLLLLSLMLVACLVLVNLYLLEIEKNHRLQNAERPNPTTPAVKSAKDEQTAHGGVCWTKDCIQAASDLLNSIDPTVNPCDDFYLYACGGWLKKNPLPEDSRKWSQFTKLENENNNLIQQIILSKEIKAKYSREEAVLKALAFYDSCMDMEQINRVKGEPLKKLIKHFGSWAVIDSNWNDTDWEFTTYMTHIHKNVGIPALFTVYVDLDLKNSSHNVIVVDEGRPGLSPGAFLKNETEHIKMREAYRELITNLSLLLGGRRSPQSEADITEIMRVDAELGKIVTPPYLKIDPNALYNKMTIKQLSEKAGKKIDWLRYLQGLLSESSHNITEDQEIVVFALDYLIKLDALVDRLSTRTLANYVMWRVVKSQYVYLSQEFEDTFKYYYIKAYDHWADSPRGDLCLASTSHAFGLPLSKIYLDLKFHGKSKALAKEIIENIRDVFIADLKVNNWMDEETKQSAKEKAEALLENIGYPDYIMDKEYMKALYKDVKIDPKTYFENEFYIARKNVLDGLAKFNKPVDNSEWTVPPTMLNAFYSYSENKMVFPAAMLQSPFYNVRYPRSINYGGIGGIMAHELTHGFDDTGKLYNKDGNLKKWWTDWTLENFSNRSRCLINQYSSKTFFGMPLDGENTLSENIADNGGIKQTFQAYQKWVKDHWEEPTLPATMLSNEKVFFISFARNWCSHYTEMAAQLAVSWDNHSPMPWRVNLTLQNFPEFSRVFECPIGSPMNPKKTCTVW